MSAETPLAEGEIHDLVLLFANSKIPRGSDAFQTLVGDFLKHDDEPDSNDDVIISDSSDSSTKEQGPVLAEGVTAVPKSVLKSKGKSVRMESPKLLSHVHWPDEENSKLASSPQTEQLHHARLYMKTTPKPILKHDENLLLSSADRKTNFRRFSSPSNIWIVELEKGCKKTIKWGYFWVECKRDKLTKLDSSS